MKSSLLLLSVLALSVSTLVRAEESVVFQEKFGPDFTKAWKLVVIPHLSDDPRDRADLEAGPDGSAIINCFFRLAEGIEVQNREGIFPNYIKMENPKFAQELTGRNGDNLTLNIRMKGSQDGRKFRVFMLTADDRIFMIYNAGTVLTVEPTDFSWKLDEPGNFAEIRNTIGDPKEEVDKTLTFPLKAFALEFMGYSGVTTDGDVEKIEIESISFTEAKGE